MPLRLAFLLSLAAFSPLPAQQREGNFPAFHHVFLIDVSGSMKNTLGGPSSPARTFFARNLFGAHPLFSPQAPADLIGFSMPGRESRAYSGAFDSQALSQTLLSGITVTSLDTDLISALHTAQSALKRSPATNIGLVWMLTDNINDPNGRGQDIEKTRAFYEHIFEKNSPVRRLYFFPLKDYKLVIYLMELASDAAQTRLETVIDSFESRLDQVAVSLGAPRIKAKPIKGQNAIFIDRRIEFSPQAQPHGAARLEGEGTSESLIVISGLQEGQPLDGTYRFKLRSRFQEWRIRKAEFTSTRITGFASQDFPRVADVGGTLPVKLNPQQISNVPPQGSSEVTYTLTFNDQQRNFLPEASFFHLPAFLPGSKGTVQARLQVKAVRAGLQLDLFKDPSATQAMDEIFHLRDIEYFVPEKQRDEVIDLSFGQNLQFEVQFNWIRRWIITGAVALAILIPAIILLRRSATPLDIRLIGYRDTPIRLMPGVDFPITLQDRLVAKLRLDRFGAVQCIPQPNVNVNGSTSPVRLSSGSQLKIFSAGVNYDFQFEVRPSQAGAPAAKTKSPYY